MHIKEYYTYIPLPLVNRLSQLGSFILTHKCPKVNGKAGENLKSLIEVQNRFFKILDCDWTIASKYGQPPSF